MPRVVASVKALPPNVISQEEVRELCGRIFEDRKDLRRLLPVMDRGYRRPSGDLTACSPRKGHFGLESRSNLGWAATTGKEAGGLQEVRDYGSVPFGGAKRLGSPAPTHVRPPQAINTLLVMPAMVSTVMSIRVVSIGVVPVTVMRIGVRQREVIRSRVGIVVRYGIRPVASRTVVRNIGRSR